jgi:hypothetical protein
LHYIWSCVYFFDASRRFGDKIFFVLKKKFEI